MFVFQNLVVDFKLTQGDNDLLSSRQTNFSVIALWPGVIPKCVFPTIGVRLTPFVLFKILEVPEL